MTIWTWPVFPASGSANFEETARAAYATLSTTNGVGIDNEIAGGRDGEATLAARSAAITVLIDALEDGSGLEDGAVAEVKLDINNAPSDLQVLKWNAGAGKMEWGTQGSATDTGEVRMDAGDPADYLGQKVDDDTIKVSGSDLLYVELDNIVDDVTIKVDGSTNLYVDFEEQESLIYFHSIHF